MPAPPFVPPELPEKVLLVTTVTAPALLKMPAPPLLAELPEKMLLVTVNVVPDPLRLMPPPLPLAFPLAMVRLLTTKEVTAGWTRKTPPRGCR